MIIYKFKRSIFIGITFLLLLVTDSVLALTYYAGVSGDWNSAIWSTNKGGPFTSHIPNDGTADVIITFPSGGPGPQITISNSINCKSIEIEKSQSYYATLALSASAIVNVTGNVSIFDGFNSSGTVENTLAIGDARLIIGGSLIIYGEGQRSGNLTIANGTIKIAGDLEFNGTNGQNIGSKTIIASGTGRIEVGGEFKNPTSGTVPAGSKDNIYVRGSYYKTAQNGGWSDLLSWYSSYDDINYFSASFIPVGNAKRISVDHEIYLSNNSPAGNLTVNGTLNCHEYFVNGPGPFVLSAGGNFITSHPEGISLSALIGAVQVDRGRSYSPNANYIYSGSSNQNTGNGLPDILGGTLTVDKTDSHCKVTISNPVLCTKLVQVIKGELASEGNLTLESIKSSYAQIGKIEINDAKVSGAVNVQSFFTGTFDFSNRGTRMISFPVADDGLRTIYQQLQEKMVITGPGGPSNGFDSGGGNPNAATLTTYYEPARPALSNVAVPHITTKTTPGKAVHVYFRGNRDNALGNKVNGPVYADPEDVVANYRGTINQGPVSIKITHTANLNDSSNGLNAIGNPYPAALDWELVYLDNKFTNDDKIKIENEIRIIKPGAGMVTRKIVEGILAVVPVEYSASSQFIQPGQGFYIKKTEEGEDSFTFIESHKAVKGSAARLLSIPSSELMATQLENGQQISDVMQKDRLLRINVQQGNLKDETLIIFKDGLSSKFDNNDAFYFAGNSVMIGSLTDDDRNTSINAMPDVKDIKVLKLYVNANVSGATTMNFTDLSVAKGYQIFLIDAIFPDELVDLKKTSIYDFIIDKANPATYGNTRFSIIFKPEPIEAPTMFTAQKVKTNVQVDWTSLVSRAVKYFEVEVSFDQQSYKNIGTVQNGGNSDINKYSFTDKSPAPSTRYYRLKQFNYNGTLSYSDVKKVDLSTDSIIWNPSIVIYPNPSLHKITVQLNGTKSENVEVSIFDLQGKKLSTASYNSNEEFSFAVNHLAKGVYLLEVKNGSDKKIIGHSKFVVGI